MKTILLIGASGGIGNKVAELLLSKEYQVIGTHYQHPERTANLQDNKLFLSRYFDLTNKESFIDTKKFLKDQNLSLYGIVNCAGIVDYETKSLEEDLQIWDKTISINLTGNYLLAKYLSDEIVENGRFLMISSTDAYFGGVVTTSYAASKSGINSLTKSLPLLLKDKKIRVNSIAPGWVETPMIEVNGDEFIKKVAEINPLKRNAKPLDVANLFVFLLSEESNYINGQVISLEGGYTNQDSTLMLEEDIQS